MQPVTASDVLNSPELMAKYLPFIKDPLAGAFTPTMSKKLLLPLFGIDENVYDENREIYFSFTHYGWQLTITPHFATDDEEDAFDAYFSWNAKEIEITIDRTITDNNIAFMRFELADRVAEYLNKLPNYRVYIDNLKQTRIRLEEERKERLRTNTIKTLIQNISPYTVETADTQLSQHLAQGWDVLNITIRTLGNGEDELTQRIVTLKRSPIVANIQAQVDMVVVLLNNLPFLNNVTPETLLPSVQKLAGEWETCNNGYAPKQTTFDNNNVHMIGGRLDNGAFHRAIMVARDLLKAGKWDGTSQLWVCDPYAMYNRVERDINTAVMRQVNGDWYTSHSADALQLILEGVMQHA